jgi:hypothetical protein
VAGLVTAEIGVGSLLEAALAIDGGVDLVIRKNEAILGRAAG